MSTPQLRQIRLRPFVSTDLNILTGNRGDIYFDATVNTLRLYNGVTGGQALLKDDLSNIKSTALNKSVNFGTGSIRVGVLL